MGGPINYDAFLAQEFPRQNPVPWEGNVPARAQLAGLLPVVPAQAKDIEIWKDAFDVLYEGSTVCVVYVLTPHCKFF